MTTEKGISEAPLVSRKDRRASTTQKAASRPLAASTARRALLPAVAIVGLLSATVGLGGGYLWGSSAGNGDWDAEVSGNLSFASIELPEGWVAEKVDTDAGTQFSDRNPIPATSGSCTFTRNTVYVDADYSGRGAEYLSTDLLYSSVLPLLTGGGGSVDALSVDNINSLSIEGEGTAAVFAQWDSGRALVRVFDSDPMEVPDDVESAGPGSIPTVLNEGIPAVVVSYTCVNPSELNDEMSESLFASVDVSNGL